MEVLDYRLRVDGRIEFLYNALRHVVSKSADVAISRLPYKQSWGFFADETPTGVQWTRRLNFYLKQLIVIKHSEFPFVIDTLRATHL